MALYIELKKCTIANEQGTISLYQKRMFFYYSSCIPWFEIQCIFKTSLAISVIYKPCDKYIVQHFFQMAHVFFNIKGCYVRLFIMGFSLVFYKCLTEKNLALIIRLCVICKKNVELSIKTCYFAFSNNSTLLLQYLHIILWNSL